MKAIRKSLMRRREEQNSSTQRWERFSHLQGGDSFNVHSSRPSLHSTAPHQEFKMERECQTPLLGSNGTRYSVRGPYAI